MSHVFSGTGTGNGNSYLASISDDGGYVAFTSTGTNLIAGSFPHLVDNVFVYERSSGSVTLLSHDAASPTTGANGHSDFPAINGDGSYVSSRARPRTS